MVNIKPVVVKFSPLSEHPSVNDVPPSLASNKRKAITLTSCLGVTFGIVLILCILYVDFYWRTSPLRWCGSMDVIFTNPEKDPIDYFQHHGDNQKAIEYSDWVRKAANQSSSCDLDCLTWRSSGTGAEIAHHRQAGHRLGAHWVSEEQCLDIPLNLRFDCLPGNGKDVGQEACEKRGCCWKPLDKLPEREKPFSLPRLHKPTHGTPLEDLPLNVPYCYFPSNYQGYAVVNFTEESYGYVSYLRRKHSSGYPFDVPVLRMDVYFETQSRLRIKIRDPSESRWESPVPIKSDAKVATSDPDYSFKIDKRSASFAVIRKATSLPVFDTRYAAPLIFADQFLQLSTRLPTDYIYGLGEHLEGLLLDTYWKRRVLWNLDQIPEPGKNLYGSHPFYLAMEPNGNAHGVYLLNSNAMDIVLQPTPALTFRAIGGILDLYVFLGPTPNDVISQYTELIGRPFLPPYWSLGYHQCRYGYESLNKTRTVWERTRSAGIPFDVQWNDIDYMDTNKDFTYDHVNYKDLPDFVDEVHKVGMHYVPIIDPGISAAEPLHTYPPWDEGLALNIFVQNASGMPFIGKVWNPVATTWPDFTHPSATYYWGRQLLRYHSWVQIDGAWIDMNEPSNFWSGSYNGCPDSNLEHPPYLPPVHGDLLYYHTICMSARQHAGLHYNVHNLYGMTETISTNVALKLIRNQRPFVISRSTFAGQGHFGGHWTGDVWSDWFNLWQSVASILNFNMFGIPMVGADICGFNGNTTASLCLRWMQLGAFYPFSRNHNTDDAIDQDPVALGEDVVVASRKALEIRYLLLPYLYSLFFRAHLTGEPVARPLFFEFFEDPSTYVIDTQFMWGSGLMIAPVLQENVTEVNAYIPKGRWYDWYTSSPIDGAGNYLTLEAPKDVIPLLVHGGTIIPMQFPANTTTDSRKNDMVLLVAPDEKGSAVGEFFWDDGDSLDTAESMNYTHVEFSAMPGSVSVNVTLIGYQAPVSLGVAFILGMESNVTDVYVDGGKVLHDYNESDKVLKAHGFKRSLLSSFKIEWK